MVLQKYLIINDRHLNFRENVHAQLVKDQNQNLEPNHKNVSLVMEQEQWQLGKALW